MCGYAYCGSMDLNSALLIPNIICVCVCAGFFGYSHLTGGYDGGQADYVRVPFGMNYTHLDNLSLYQMLCHTCRVPMQSCKQFLMICVRCQCRGHEPAQGGGQRVGPGRAAAVRHPPHRLARQRAGRGTYTHTPMYIHLIAWHANEMAEVPTYSQTFYMPIRWQRYPHPHHRTYPHTRIPIHEST
jgi:hypothetical protein